MVHNGGDLLEQPLVRAVANEEQIVGLICSQITPAPRDDGANSCSFDGTQDHGHQALGISYNNTSKANVDWAGARVQKPCQVVWRSIRRRVAKEEAADIYVFSPVGRLSHQRWRPAVCEWDF